MRNGKSFFPFFSSSERELRLGFQLGSSDNRQVVLVGLDPLEEEREVVVLDVAMHPLLALPVHQADVPLPGAQIDSAVVFRSGGVVLHTCSIIGVQRTPVNVRYAGSVDSTPRPITLMIQTDDEFLAAFEA